MFGPTGSPGCARRCRCGEEVGDLPDRRLAVVVREQHLGPDGLRGRGGLFRRHRVGLVHGQERDVDVLHVRHLRDVLGVAGDVDPKPAEIEDVAVVAPLWVELLAARGRVVGGDGLDGDVLAEVRVFAVRKRDSGTEHPADGGVGVDGGAVLAERGDGGRVEVVEVLVRDEDEVRFRERRVVGRRLALRADGVDLDLEPVVLDADAGVLDAREDDGLSVRRLERVRLERCDGVRVRLGEKCENAHGEEGRCEVFHAPQVYHTAAARESAFARGGVLTPPRKRAARGV